MLKSSEESRTAHTSQCPCILTGLMMANDGLAMKTRKLLVLDLDETLMFASVFRLPTVADFRLGLAQAVRRPGLDAFLDRCFSLFQVAIWTSATAEYAADALSQLLPANADLAFVWSREKCYRETDHVLGDQYWVKDASLLTETGFALESLLVLDDEPRSWVSHLHRVLPVPKFRGDPEDKVLICLLPKLSEAAAAPDIPMFLRSLAL
jgi:TFIIF-interacting CTD phosphatase-like protein